MNDTVSSVSASWIVTLGIPAIAAVMGTIVSIGYARVSRKSHAHAFSPGALARPLAFVVLWSTLVGAVASTGVLLRMDVRPPPFAIMFLGILALGFSLGFGPVGRRLTQLPVPALVGVHAFRLPLELVMHQAAVDGVMPVQMSYSGWNFDILTGLTAIPVAYLAAKGRAPRALVMGWNLLGTALLVNILTIAMVSSPLLMLFGNAPHQVNTWVAHFPFVYLPTVLVVIAITGHVTVWRKLFAERLRDSSVTASANA